MFSSLHAPFAVLIQGFMAGLIFGFLLQRGKVGRFDTIVGQFLLRDFTVLKIMLTAIIVGGIGVYALLDLGHLSSLPLKASSLIGSSVGGAIFGIGMAILGYCPGTALTALAEGAKDVWFGLLGMLVGTIFFEMTYPWIQQNILAYHITVATLPVSLQLPHWLIFTTLLTCAALLFYIIENASTKQG